MKDPARQAAQGFFAALRMTAGESAAMGNGCHREGRAMKIPRVKRHGDYALRSD